MRGIFISYRREDSEGQAGRLFDDLVAHFGRDAVFMDVANIKKGLDFRRSIEEQVAACGVLLVMIGKHWTDAADAQGQSRLDDANDFVRLETAAALAREIPVVPVLVQGASMPREKDLPDALKPLAFRNGTELTHARWDSDVKLLIDDLRPYVDAKVVSGGGGEALPKRKGWLIGVGVAVVVAGIVGVLALRPKPPPIHSDGSTSTMKDAAVEYVDAASAGSKTGCLAGYEWRLATPDDHACVLPQEHAQAVADNAQAGTRREGGGAYGATTCKTGYVWREARPGDVVCVTPELRKAVLVQNNLATIRSVRPNGPKP